MKGLPYLKQGIYVDDVQVLHGAVPEAAPTLVTHGFETQHNIGGTYVVPDFYAVFVDFTGGTNPKARLKYYGYVTPPSAGALLTSDWQELQECIVSDNNEFPQVALFPVGGISRAAITVAEDFGVPTSVEYRIVGIDAETAEVLVASGVAAFSKGTGFTVAEVTNGVDDTYYYYFAAREFKRLGFQMILDGGSGAVTVTFEATHQDDGTAADTCAYLDVTTAAFGVANYVASGQAIDTSEILSTAKYVRIKVVAATGGANDADWSIYASGLRH